MHTGRADDNEIDFNEVPTTTEIKIVRDGDKVILGFLYYPADGGEQLFTHILLTPEEARNIGAALSKAAGDEFEEVVSPATYCEDVPDFDPE